MEGCGCEDRMSHQHQTLTLSLTTGHIRVEWGVWQYAVWGETGTVCRYTTHCHDTMSHMTPSPRDNVVTQRGDSRHSALSTWLIWSPHLSPPPGWPRCSPYDVSLQTCGHSPVCDGHISTGVTIHHWPGSPEHNESWFVWLPAPIPSCPLLAGETPGWALHGRM